MLDRGRGEGGGEGKGVGGSFYLSLKTNARRDTFHKRFPRLTFCKRDALVVGLRYCSFILIDVFHLTIKYNIKMRDLDPLAPCSKQSKAALRDRTLISRRNICRRGPTVSIKNKVNFGCFGGNRWLALKSICVLKFPHADLFWLYSYARPC